jgi:hypothetical protein
MKTPLNMQHINTLRGITILHHGIRSIICAALHIGIIHEFCLLLPPRQHPYKYSATIIVPLPLDDRAMGTCPINVHSPCTYAAMFNHLLGNGAVCSTCLNISKSRILSHDSKRFFFVIRSKDLAFPSL